MVSPSSGPTPRPGRPSFTQVAASALAAVSAALISSTFGVAGTLIGAAIASIVASVGSTLYLASLRSTNERLRRMAVAAKRTDSPGALPSRPIRPLPGDVRGNEPALPFPSRYGDRAGDVAADAPTRVLPVTGPPAGWSRLRWSNLRWGLPTLRRRWVAVAGLAVLVFAVAIGALTAVQASTNQQLSLGGGGSTSPAPTMPPPPATTGPSLTPTPSSSPTASPTPTVTPSIGASASATPGPGAASPASASPSPTVSPSVGVTPSPGPTTPATVP